MNTQDSRDSRPFPILYSAGPYLFLVCSALLFTISMFTNRSYFHALAAGSVCFYQLRQVLCILFLYLLGYLFLKTIQHRLDGLWVCLLAFPAAICLWCFMSEFLLLADFTYRFLRVLFLISAFILLCFFIRRFRKIPLCRPTLPVLKTIAVIAGTACLVSTGYNYIIVNYDSYFYFSDYGKALTLMMSYKDIVSDNSFVMTNIGQFLPLVSSYATYFKIDTIIPIQGFMILNLLAAFAVCVYRYAKSAFPVKKAICYTVLFTLLLISCSPFLLFTNWILSNTWIMFYLFFLFLLGMKERPEDHAFPLFGAGSSPLDADRALLICGFSVAVTMLRKDGIAFVCFLFICYSWMWSSQGQPRRHGRTASGFRAWCRSSLPLTLLFIPSAGYQLFYIYYLRHIIYARTTLAYGTSLLSDKFSAMILLAAAAVLLYLLFLHSIAEKLFKKYLPHAITVFLLLVLLLLCIKDVGRFIDYTDTWIRNLAGTAFGYSCLGILLFVCLILLSRPPYDYLLFATAGSALLTLIIYWNKGNLELNIDNSGLRALYQIIPIFFLASAVHLRRLFAPNAVDARESDDAKDSDDTKSSNNAKGSDDVKDFNGT